MQPGRKGRFATKTSNFSKELNEDLLCEIFRLRDVTGHPQTEGINPAIMALVELLEGVHVALSGLLSQRVIRLLLCLGFGCGHVFVCSGKQRRNITSSCLFAATITSPPISRERYPSPQDLPSAVWCEVNRYPQRGCDAALRARRCLTRP